MKAPVQLWDSLRVWYKERREPLVTDEVIDFEKYPVEVQDFKKIIEDSGGICGI